MIRSKVTGVLKITRDIIRSNSTAHRGGRVLLFGKNRCIIGYQAAVIIILFMKTILFMPTRNNKNYLYNYLSPYSGISIYLCLIIYKPKLILVILSSTRVSIYYRFWWTYVLRSSWTFFQSQYLIILFYYQIYTRNRGKYQPILK